MHELEEDLVHDLGEVLLDPGHHVAAHADLAPRVQGHRRVVLGDELDLGRADGAEGGDVQLAANLAVP